MRRRDEMQGSMFLYGSLEERVPAKHPLRRIRPMVDAVLKEMSPWFSKLYSKTGRPSIPPERLLRASLLQIFYSIRSERQLMEQLDYNLLFRWFVGLDLNDPVWDHSTFSKNRERLLNEKLADGFFDRVLKRAEGLISEEHFSVDGTLIEAWASHKSFRPKRDSDAGEGPAADAGDATESAASGASANPNGQQDEQDMGADGDEKASDPEQAPAREESSQTRERDFHGERRRNETHESTTDPEARLYRKGKGAEAKLCYLGHAVMENRNGLLVNTRLTHAEGTAERLAALEMIEEMDGRHRITVGADKAYDTKEFVRELRNLQATPHVAQNNKGRRSAIDGRVTKQPGYEASQRIRKRIEQAFGWMKTVGGMRKVKLRGRWKVGWAFTFTAAAYNLWKLARLEPA
jgi:transposase